MKNKYGFTLPPPPGVLIAAVRDLPPEFTPEKIREQTEAFLKKGGKIQDIPIGASAIEMTASVSLGIRSHSNMKQRETIAPKRGYLRPDSL
jgi:hypothetical protein